MADGGGELVDAPKHKFSGNPIGIDNRAAAFLSFSASWLHASSRRQYQYAAQMRASIRRTNTKCALHIVIFKALCNLCVGICGDGETALRI